MRQMAFLAALLFAMPAAALEWVAAEGTGCQVWNEDPRPGETVTWSGNCIDGKADGFGSLTYEYVRDDKRIVSVHWGAMASGKPLGIGNWNTLVVDAK